ncbi:uncharacterized protein LOC128954322 [Oppia nitens]|uniref:uncharacterized protein LOC128954322 n=1 Tax=Oppia nitens TaxID=1686743 RepID=UPI0023D9DD72|nr:uncharacterized protein LOC128954322 [Oppia nitens]
MIANCWEQQSAHLDSRVLDRANNRTELYEDLLYSMSIDRHFKDSMVGCQDHNIQTYEGIVKFVLANTTAHLYILTNAYDITDLVQLTYHGSQQKPSTLYTLEIKKRNIHCKVRISPVDKNRFKLTARLDNVKLVNNYMDLIGQKSAALKADILYSSVIDNPANTIQEETIKHTIHKSFTTQLSCQNFTKIIKNDYKSDYSVQIGFRFWFYPVFNVQRRDLLIGQQIDNQFKGESIIQTVDQTYEINKKITVNPYTSVEVTAVVQTFNNMNNSYTADLIVSGIGPKFGSTDQLKGLQIYDILYRDNKLNDSLSIKIGKNTISIPVSDTIVATFAVRSYTTVRDISKTTTTSPTTTTRTITTVTDRTTTTNSNILVPTPNGWDSNKDIIYLTDSAYHTYTYNWPFIIMIVLYFMACPNKPTLNYPMLMPYTVVEYWIVHQLGQPYH